MVIRAEAAEQTVAHQVPDARHHAAAVLIVDDRAAAAHEREDKDERDQERRAVDDEHAGAVPTHWDQRAPAIDGPITIRGGAARPPKSPGRLRDRSSRPHREPLGGSSRCDAVVRGHEESRAGKTIRTSSGNVGALSSGRSGTSARERGTDDVPRRASTSARRAAATTRARPGMPKQRHRQDLGRENDAHLRRRARRDEHEPRQGHEGHRAAGARDGFGGEQGREGSMVPGMADDNIVRPYVFLESEDHAESLGGTPRGASAPDRGGRAARLRRARGGGGATVEVLERETGLSRGAIFSYFPSKLDLFVALAQEDQARLIERWLNDGWEGVVRHIVEDDPEWLGVYLDASRTPADRSRAARAVADVEPRGPDRARSALPAPARGGRDPRRRSARHARPVPRNRLRRDRGAAGGALRRPDRRRGTLELPRSALAPK